MVGVHPSRKSNSTGMQPMPSHAKSKIARPAHFILYRSRIIGLIYCHAHEIKQNNAHRLEYGKIDSGRVGLELGRAE